LTMPISVKIDPFVARQRGTAKKTAVPQRQSGGAVNEPTESPLAAVGLRTNEQLRILDALRPNPGQIQVLWPAYRKSHIQEILGKKPNDNMSRAIQGIKYGPVKSQCPGLIDMGFVEAVKTTMEFDCMTATLYRITEKGLECLQKWDALKKGVAESTETI